MRTFAFIAPLLLALGCSESDPAFREWPAGRPIQIVCFTNAGGDTDVISRTLAQGMEQILDTRINVINKPGAHGGLAMRDVYSRRHDGYRWGGFSSNVLIAPVMNGHDTTSKDWTYLIVGGSPGILSVGADSPYRTLDDLIASAKAAPETINASASTTGGVWHIQLATLEQEAGVRFNFVPYEGSHPSQLALLSDEVAVTLTSLAEQAELIRGGKLRPLAAMQTEPAQVPGFAAIPPVAAQFPGAADLAVRQWLGFGLPRDTPPDVLAKITAAFQAALASDLVTRTLESRLMTKVGLTGQAADASVQRTERAWTWILQDLGIAERSPAGFNIPRPE
jgi:tripartite-type tricarboxylate transporter receptor subunit TctC